jgi:hypothetical protein
MTKQDPIISKFTACCTLLGSVYYTHRKVQRSLSAGNYGQGKMKALAILRNLSGLMGLTFVSHLEIKGSARAVVMIF